MKNILGRENLKDAAAFLVGAMFLGSVAIGAKCAVAYCVDTVVDKVGKNFQGVHLQLSSAVLGQNDVVKTNTWQFNMGKPISAASTNELVSR